MGRRKQWIVADLFCGAGGTSTGAQRALEARGIKMKLVAINHEPIAIETHQRNHPGARHYCVNLDAANLLDIVPEGRLDLLMASPECTHHSRARGGMPVNDQSRMSAWHVLRWVTTLRVERILIENVPEFRDWGRLMKYKYKDKKTGKMLSGWKPDPRYKGEHYQAFLAALRNVGYRVEDRVLCAADYGDATTRERLFIMARLDGKKIRWPEPSHEERKGDDTLFGPAEERERWRGAREIIDWSIPGKSIFERKKPLATNTLRRIAVGLRRFGGPLSDAFLVVLRNHCSALSIDDPVPTITASGTHIGMAQVELKPFICANRTNNVPHSVDDPVPSIVTSGNVWLVDPEITPFVLGQQSCAAPRSVDKPIPTVATKGKIALIQPVLVNMKGRSDASDIDGPVPTITSHARHLAVAVPEIEELGPASEPIIVQIDQTGSNGACVRSVDQPLSTVITKQNLALVEAFLMQVNHGDGTGKPDRRVKSIDEPVPTVTARHGMALVEPTYTPYITLYYGDKNGKPRPCRSIDDPLSTITTNPRFGLVEPFLIPYYSNGSGKSVEEPLDTVTTRARFALVESILTDPDCPLGRLIIIDGMLFKLDIRFRMLKNHELARAMSFSDEEFEYEFVGTGEEVTKQIGNAVPVRLAAALVTSFAEK